MSSLKSRKYLIGLCFLCQECLYCSKNCSNRGCRCRNNKEVTPEHKKRQPRKYYSRAFQPKNSIKSYQLDELKRANEDYGYKINFSKEFNFSLCTKCHNKYNRLGKKVDKNQEEEIEIIMDADDPFPLEIADTSTLRNISPSLSSINISGTADTNTSQNFSSRPSSEPNEKYMDSLASEPLSFEIKFKLILKFSDGKCYPAKWEFITVEDFYEFKNGLENLIQLQLEDQVIFQDDYIISYKHEKGSGLGTQLASTRDWKEFLKEYNCITSNKKVLVIIITMKKKLTNKQIHFSDEDDEETGKKKKKSTSDDRNKRNKEKTSLNQIPKEKNINEEDAEIAKNKNNLATFDEPPTLPLFDAAISVKRNNLQNSNISTSNPFYPSSSNITTSPSFIAMPFPFYNPGMFNNQQNLQFQANCMPNNFSQVPQTNTSLHVPSIEEFFENLSKEFGENIFEEVKNKFIQETIDVLDIFDLKESDWQDLNVKIGLKTKIIREAEKYRK
ncbi:unnamed protein product [Rhizophagus irregularis]|nr:unnamed protein product [Rhizophagus irregularis]CAB5374286.1 unnamed protein product [Rhizophagus irregularis]